MFDRYIAHVEVLKRIRAHGGAESSEEDALLESMDAIWSVLSEPERALVRSRNGAAPEVATSTVPEVQLHLLKSSKECPVCGIIMFVFAMERDGKKFIIPGSERCFNEKGKAPNAKIPGPCAKAHERPSVYSWEMYTEEILE
jgi:hypothetical protein